MNIIVRPTYIRRRAHAAFMRGAGPRSHGFHPWTAAARTFELRYQRLAKLASRGNHHALGALARIELQQGVV